ncbi:MAG: hypothetical protein H6837_16795 [Planctomycetes bacterium]|nr:hypothetical protein [Planctomycetota bacterium]
MSRAVVYLLVGLVAVAVLSVVGWVVLGAGKLPDGPSAIVWDRQACEFCSMHVGEPAFAAQIQDRTGRTLVFDDPGCLFLYRARTRGAEHAVWFHHVRADRWIPERDVAFVRVDPTPMGYGLGAVDAGTPGSIDLAAASRSVLEKSAGGK